MWTVRQFSFKIDQNMVPTHQVQHFILMKVPVFGFCITEVHNCSSCYTGTITQQSEQSFHETVKIMLPQNSACSAGIIHLWLPAPLWAHFIPLSHAVSTQAHQALSSDYSWSMSGTLLPLHFMFQLLRTLALTEMPSHQNAISSARGSLFTPYKVACPQHTPLLPTFVLYTAVCSMIRQKQISQGWSLTPSLGWSLE